MLAIIDWQLSSISDLKASHRAEAIMMLLHAISRSLHTEVQTIRVHWVRAYASQYSQIMELRMQEMKAWVAEIALWLVDAMATWGALAMPSSKRTFARASIESAWATRTRTSWRAGLSWAWNRTTQDSRRLAAEEQPLSTRMMIRRSSLEAAWISTSLRWVAWRAHSETTQERAAKARYSRRRLTRLIRDLTHPTVFNRLARWWMERKDLSSELLHHNQRVHCRTTTKKTRTREKRKGDPFTHEAFAQIALIYTSKDR